MSSPSAQGLIAAGVDGWRNGWIVAIGGRGGVSDGVEFVVCDDYEAVIACTGDCAAVAVDIPIALPIAGVRHAEEELSAYLGRARSSLFWSPCREAMAAPTHAEAVAINKGLGGKGPSIQGWGLRAKIIETRIALTDLTTSHHETHPESGFTMMNGGEPLATKKSALGVAQRLQLLRRSFGTIDDALLFAPPRVPIDDVLDACAALWTAQRIATGTDRRFGPEGCDDEGFEQGISV